VVSRAVDPSRRHFLALSLVALSCRKLRAPVGRPVPGIAPAGRIVSLSPSITDSLFALGAGDRVVGISNLCDLPAAARLPRVGTMVVPSFEAIMALRPDALVAVEGPVRDEVIARLQAAGVRVYALRFESLADVRAAMPKLATLGARPGAATELLGSIDAGLAGVRRSLEGRARPRVIAVCAQTPLVVAGPASWIGELMTLAGGDNPVRSNNTYPVWSLEQVMSQVPELILDLTSPAAPLAEAWAGQTGIPAVTAGHVRRIDDLVVRRQGPRVVDAVRRLVGAIHPGVTL
jgi:iron complex transport system substrate-binding protein